MADVAADELDAEVDITISRALYQRVQRFGFIIRRFDFNRDQAVRGTDQAIFFQRR